MEGVRSSPIALPTPNMQDGKQLLQAQAVCTASPVQEQWQGWLSQARPSHELAPLTFHDRHNTGFCSPWHGATGCFGQDPVYTWDKASLATMLGTMVP